MSGQEKFGVSADRILLNRMQKYTHRVEKGSEMYQLKQDKQRAMDCTKGLHTPESRGWSPYANQISKKF